MPSLYAVQWGDCLTSIAAQSGFALETLWNHPQNAALKARRGDPNLLNPGDQVFIPDLRGREVERACNRRHTFRRKSVPAKFRIRLIEENAPRSHVPYSLTAGEQTFTGQSDAGGLIEAAIPPMLQMLTLTLGSGEEAQTFEINLGYLNPITTVSGIKARLNNLGFDCGSVDETADDALRTSLKAFQNYIGHPNPTGELTAGALDAQTRDSLLSLHENAQNL